MTKQDLPGVGVFGTDTATKKIVPLLRDEGFNVQAIWGRTREEAELVASELQIPFATNHVDEVLLKKDVDLVVILCPPAQHSQIAVKALGIGKHVAVQCPGGLSQDEVLRMVQAAQYYPRLKAVVCCPLRFLPAFDKMRRAVANGLVGADGIRLCDVRVGLRGLVGKRFSWRCDEGMGGGVLNLVGSHIVDLLHFVTDGIKVVRTHGVLRTLVEETDTIRGIRRIGADDFASFQLELETGALATVTLHSQESSFKQEVTISGNEGNLVARNGSLFHCRRGGREEPLYIEDMGGEVTKKGEGPPEADGEDTLVSGMFLQGLGLLFRQLSATFKSDAGCSEDGSVGGNAISTLATFQHAQYVQSVLEAVRRSARQRTWTQVTMKTDDDVAVAAQQQAMSISPKANLWRQQHLQQRR